MGLTCTVVAGTLYMIGTLTSGSGEVMVQPSTVKKDPASDIVTITDNARQTFQFEIGQQHQLRMGTAEFMSDCIYTGHFIPNYAQQEMNTPVDPHSIDSEERTGVDDG